MDATDWIFLWTGFSIGGSTQIIANIRDYPPLTCAASVFNFIIPLYFVQFFARRQIELFYVRAQDLAALLLFVLKLFNGLNSIQCPPYSILRGTF